MLIKTKTLIGSTLIGATAALITGITIGYLSSMKAGDAVEIQVKNQLKSIRDAKKAQIEDYITNIEAQVVDLALSPTVTDYLPDFTRGFNEVQSAADPYSKISQSQNASEFYSNVFGEVYRENNGQLPNEIETVYQGFNPAALALQDVYIYENPHPLGSKNSLADAGIDSLYHNTHAHAHPHLQHFLESFGFYDVFLTDNAGNVVYSVFKEADYATSLTSGPFSNSGLATAYRAALELDAGEFYIDDFKPYTPSYESPAAFISSPVFKNGERLGTLIFQFPVDRINDIMTFDHKWKIQGMGDTGEVFLVGDDSKPRSELRQQTQYHDKFIDDLKTSGYDNALIETIDRLGTSVGYLPLDLPVVTSALSGKSGVYSVQGLGDERLVAAYTSLDIKGINWGLIASFNESEAFAAKESLVNTILLTVLIVVAVVCAIAAASGQVFAQQIINPLALLGSTVSQMASRNSGSNQTDLPHSDDEIGDIFKALGTLVNRLEDDAQQQATIAAANGRIREALDVSSACVLVADSDANVIFANKAVSELFAKRRSELESAISGFNAHDLRDLSLPTFFTDKNASENVLKNLTSEYNDRLEYAGATFDIVVIPVINQGELTGYVMQWKDITAELAIEKEVQSLVSKASNGDLSERLNESNKTGFYARLSKDLNELLNVTEDALEDIASLLSNLASGDLTTEISRSYNGTFGQIIDDANRSLSRLTEVVGDISSSSDQIATGASEIAQANFSLQSRTESQAAALEETANNILQLNDAVKVSHSQAEKVNTVVQRAAKKAEEGGESVRDVIDSMEMIRNSSTEISNIISVINEIAFQTNVLALNAAVEAARAGEEGRGFAVVAGEVRMLAQRSAKAAGEIKGLIEDSVSKVHNGVERVNVSGEVLQELIGAMKEVRSLADQVSSASQQQYEDIQQVSGSVEELKNGTNQNAAMVEELSATTQNMADQANDGKKAISFFTVDKVTSSAI